MTCKCGHEEREHLLVAGELSCMANRINELDDDEEPCLCSSLDKKHDN